MREVSPKVQGVFRQVNQVTHQAADKIVAPVIKVKRDDRPGPGNGPGNGLPP